MEIEVMSVPVSDKVNKSIWLKQKNVVIKKYKIRGALLIFFFFIKILAGVAQNPLVTNYMNNPLVRSKVLALPEQMENLFGRKLLLTGKRLWFPLRKYSAQLPSDMIGATILPGICLEKMDCQLPIPD